MKLFEWGGQKRKPSVCAINAQSGTSLQIVPPPPSPQSFGNGSSRKFPENLARDNSCTNANYIWARSCGNGEAKNAIPPFVQLTHKAVRACKLFLLDHHRIMPSMEIRANSQQTLVRNRSCTNAIYIWATSCGNGEAKNVNHPFLQSMHKAVRACKLILLHHSRKVSVIEIHVNSLQTLARDNSCTNVNHIWARGCGNGEAKNANHPFLQSMHKAVRACKLILLHHRRKVSAMEFA